MMVTMYVFCCSLLLLRGADIELTNVADETPQMVSFGINLCLLFLFHNNNDDFFDEFSTSVPGFVLE